MENGGSVLLTGCDAIDADISISRFLCSHFGQTNDGTFTGAVDAYAGKSLYTGNTRRIDLAMGKRYMSNCHRFIA